MLEGIPGGIHEGNPEEIKGKTFTKPPNESLKKYQEIGKTLRNILYECKKKILKESQNKFLEKKRIPDKTSRGIPEEKP